MASAPPSPKNAEKEQGAIDLGGNSTALISVTCTLGIECSNPRGLVGNVRMNFIILFKFTFHVIKKKKKGRFFEGKRNDRDNAIVKA